MKFKLKRLLSAWVLLGLVTALTWVPDVTAQVRYTPELFEKLARTRNPIPAINIPTYQKRVLENGLKLYLVEDRTLPIVIMGGLILGGQSLETSEEAGISDFLTDLMNTGTKRYSEMELGSYRETHGVHFQITAESDSFALSGNALSVDQRHLMALAVEILQHPRFDRDYFKRKQYQREQGLRQAKLREDNLVNMFFYKNIMKGHPYAFQFDYDQQLAVLEDLTPTRLNTYYQRVIVPNRTVLYLYGDLDHKAIKDLEAELENWSVGEKLPFLTKVPENEDTYGRIVLVDKADATQARIKLGYLFDREALFDDNLQDFTAFEIANTIYGGGDFESRLMQEIRSKKGYAYGIHSAIYAPSLGGAYHVNTSVPPDKALETIESIRRMMVDLQSDSASLAEEEVFQVINLRNAFFPAVYRQADEVLQSVIYQIELKQRSENYLNQYIKAYNKVTAESAGRVFSNYVFPEKIFTVIVGQKEALLPQFEIAGIPVDVIEP